MLGKMSSSKECQKGLRSSYPPQRGAWRRGQPPHLPAELRKRAGKWVRGPGTSVPHGGRGSVGVGCRKKEKSPGLPKPSVWVESRPLIIHLPPHSSPGHSPDQRIPSFHQILKVQDAQSSVNADALFDRPLCPRQSPVTSFLTPSSSQELCRAAPTAPTGQSQNLPRRWDILAGQRQVGP